MVKDINKNEEIIEEKTTSHCLACGDELFNYNILICAGCLGEQCETFLKLAKTVDEDPLPETEDVII